MDLPSDLILFEDNRYLIVNKPAGMPTAGDTLEQPGSMQHMLMTYMSRMVWAVHQLDRDTSGVNVFVKRKSRVDRTAQALKSGIKDYLAISDTLARDVPNHFYIREPLTYLRAIRRHGVHLEDGKPAKSEVTVLERGQAAALLRVRLHTGRTHQIRAHLEHLNIALLGDHLYGKPAVAARAPRHMLHASKVVLHIDELPLSEITAPCPQDFVGVAAPLFPEFSANQEGTS